MTEMIDDSKFKPYTFVLSRCKLPAEGTGQKTLAEAGRHPKCKLVSGQVITLLYSTSADIFAIEHEDGGNVATATQSGTVGTPTALSIAPAAGYSAVFERNEPIIEIASTEGNAANATMIVCVFETVE